MAKPLVLRFAGADLPFEMERVDRSRLYGSVEVEAVDEKGRRCELATLADDGRTLIGPGGTAAALVGAEGEWLEKSQLKPVDPEGKAIVPVPSSFAAPVPVDRKVTIDEFLSHNIRSLYVLRGAAEAAPIVKELQAGAIFCFPYSFRGGLEAEAAFLLGGKDGAVFLAIGHPTRIRFVGLEQASALSEEPAMDEGGEEESLDFGMM